MRRVAVLAAGGLALLAIGFAAGTAFVGGQAARSGGLIDDPDLMRALISVGAAPFEPSDCALGDAPTVATFLADYLAAAHGEGVATGAVAECGGRGEGLCSVSFGRPSGEHTDTKILLFARDGAGAVSPDGISCIAQ